MVLRPDYLSERIHFGFSDDQRAYIDVYDYLNGNRPQLTLQPYGGNIGIGMLNPQKRLHVNGDIAIQSSGVASTINYLTWIRDNDNWTSARIGQMYNDRNYGSHLVFETHNNNGDFASISEKMRITDMGDVGIGTTSPDSKLTVKGKIHAEEVKIDLNIPVPDYVFETEYDLRNLSELESFIQINKHLPEVPSATEVKDNGLAIGEMQMILLKKIEELTLYIIDQKKEIDALKRQMADVHKNNNEAIPLNR